MLLNSELHLFIVLQLSKLIYEDSSNWTCNSKLNGERIADCEIPSTSNLDYITLIFVYSLGKNLAGFL